jgi:hypothetical protein
MSINYSDYDLPSFINGPTRRRPAPYQVDECFTGTPILEPVVDDIDDLPVSWDVTIIINGNEQGAEFRRFIDDLDNEEDKTFIKVMVTEVGDHSHELRIVSGIPQMQQIGPEQWKSSFTVYSDFLNRTIIPIFETPTGGHLPLDWFNLEPRYSDSGSSFGITSLAMKTGTDTVVAGFADGYASISHDAGRNFDSLPRFINSGKTSDGSTDAINGIAITPDGQTIVAVMQQGYASISTDNGATFSALPNGLNMNLSGVDLVDVCISGDGQKIFVVGFAGQSAISNDGGATFSPAGPDDLNSGGSSTAFTSCAMSNDGQTIVATQWSGFSSISTNGGANWSALPVNLNTSASGLDINDVAMSSDGQTIFVVFDGGYASISRNGGGVWEEIPRYLGLPSLVGNPLTVTMSDDGNVIVAGFENGNGAVSINNAESFQQISNYFGTGVVANSTGSVVNNNKTFIAGLNNGYVGVSTNQYNPTEGPQYPEAVPPDVWIGLPRGLNNNDSATRSVTSVEMSIDGNRFYAFFDNGFSSFSTDQGNTFAQTAPQHLNSGASGGEDIFDTCMSYDGMRIYSIHEGGWASRSIDGGVTWQPMIRGLNSGSGTFNGETLACSEDGMIIFAGFTGNYASMSYDGGDTWTAMPRGLGNGGNGFIIYESSMSADGQIIFVGFRQGYVSLSTDGGATWNALTQNLGGPTGHQATSTSMSADGQIIAVGFTDGNGAVSTDAGTTWNAIPANASMPITTRLGSCAVTHDGAIIMFGGESGYASYSTDNGATFTNIDRTLGTGLFLEIAAIATSGSRWFQGMFGGGSSITDIII